MSSILKKSGLGAFKPKVAPRRRPNAGSASQGPEGQSKTPTPAAVAFSTSSELPTAPTIVSQTLPTQKSHATGATSVSQAVEPSTAGPVQGVRQNTQAAKESHAAINESLKSLNKPQEAVPVPPTKPAVVEAPQHGAAVKTTGSERARTRRDSQGLADKEKAQADQTHPSSAPSQAPHDVQKETSAPALASSDRPIVEPLAPTSPTAVPVRGAQAASKPISRPGQRKATTASAPSRSKQQPAIPTAAPVTASATPAAASEQSAVPLPESAGTHEKPAVLIPEAAPAPEKSVVTTSAPTPSNESQSETTPPLPVTESVTAGPAKRTRKRKALAASQQSADGDIQGDGNPSAPKQRKPRAKKTTTAAITDSEQGENEAVQAPKKRQRKRKAQPEDNENAETGNEGEEGEESAPKTKKPRKERSVTPEDAESQTVDHSQLTMGDLTRDLRIGKKFSRHDELRERLKQKRSQQRLERLGRIKKDEATPEAGSKAGTPAPDAPGEGGSATPTPATETGPVIPSGLQFQMVDGQIIVDSRTLTVDRHARAAAEAGMIETVEENDFTRLTTSASYMRPDKVGPNFWNDEDTELFYRALKMWGTDFGLIAKMFGGRKTRRQVKLKFNREEKYCPRRINAAIVGEKTVKIDLDEYKEHTGLEYEAAEDIEAELRQLAERREAEARAAEEEAAEAARKKKEALFGKGGAGGGSDSAKENNGEGATDVVDMASVPQGKGKSRGRGRGKRALGQPVQAEAGGFGA
ncbi:Transcription factor TFIIIB component B [Pleurostoma richardsiae]|uniref:Transcription factor TFIIIB component B n=1 Tax=Pleurostoma richardsiae TaxID=41990 RepID=A0AA38VF09_9PEZI|nr:Transcription factor TFIIIB component B [Pleurostoma richardsiae]